MLCQKAFSARSGTPDGPNRSAFSAPDRSRMDESDKRPAGRPRTASTIAELVVRMAQENPRWGYTRIRGALGVLGHQVGRNTIKRLLLEAGLEPAPERGRSGCWSTFLRAYWDAIAAADFFTVEVLTLSGLQRYCVFFVMELKTRRVEIAGLAPVPNGPWLAQVARNVLDAVDGFLLGKRFLILDRDPLYTRGFHAALERAGVQPVRLPPRSPNLNAFAERFILSARSECLNHVVPLGEGHLRWLLKEYMAHYHGERTHRGLGNKLVDGQDGVANLNVPVKCRKRVGGLL